MFYDEKGGGFLDNKGEAFFLVLKIFFGKNEEISDKIIDGVICQATTE